MSLIIASVVMGMDGAFYCVMGACMLFPSSVSTLIKQRLDLTRLYPSLFKAFLCDQCDARNPYSNNNDVDDPEPPGIAATNPSVLNPPIRPLGELVHELAYRLLAYLLIMAGVARLITGIHWGCGYIYLALATCLAEIALVCNELLRQDAILLHRGMGVFLCNMVLSLVYLSAGLPYCTVC
jgi:hypothetical protein